MMNALQSFLLPPNGEYTPEEIERRKMLAQALLQQSQGAEPIGSPWQGAAKLAQALMGGLAMKKANGMESANRKAGDDLFSQAWGAANMAPANDTLAGGSGTDNLAGGTGGDRDLKKALLDAIAGTESAGKYDVIYGGSKMNGYADHPRVAVPIKSGPNKGKTSSAAGKYQFLGRTWDQYKNKLGLKDFSPGSQDAAAWALASDVYKAKTGGDLEKALKSGDPATLAAIGKALSGTWTSLPGGIEAGTNSNRFVQAINNGGAGAPTAAPPPQAPPPSPMGTMGARPPMPQAPPPQMAAAQPQVMPTAGPAPAAMPQAQAQPMSAYDRMIQTALAKGSLQEARPGQNPMARAAIPGQMAPQAPQMAQAAPQPGMAPQQGNPQAMAQPQGGMPSSQRIGAFIQSPNFSKMRPEQQRMVYDLYQQAREAEKPPNPMDALKLEREKLELENLHKPKPGYRVLTPEEKQRMGIPPDAPVQQGPDGKIEVINDLMTDGAKLPSAVQEYEYAKKQGFTGTFQEWEAQKKSPGMSIQLPDGTVIQQGGKAFTEGQSKDIVYSTRAEGALDVFEPQAEALAQFWSANVGNVPLIGNYLKSDEYQQAEQAAKEFLAPILRKDTGAAVTPQEFVLYGSTFIPMPGDNPTTLAQKKTARRRAVDALKAGMPAAAILAQAQAVAKTAKTADSHGRPDDVPQEEWDALTPEERALWK